MRRSGTRADGEGRERQLLLGIFLMEAWDTAGTLEEGLPGLSGPRTPAARDVEPLLVVAHRLKGSAALHGFPGVSELAGTTERLLERVSTTSAEERGRAASFLGEAVILLKDIFDGISAAGVEDSGRIAEFKARHPSFCACEVAHTTAAAPPEGEPPSAQPVKEHPGSAAARQALQALPVGAPGRAAWLVQEVDRFFTGAGEVLSYFGPEAAEHLEVMTGSLLALEAGGRNDEALATLFRACHTLKGAAYTVGCAPVGDVAHEIEDLLGAVRAQRVPFTPVVAEAIFAAVVAIKQILQSIGGSRADLGEALERAVDGLRALIATGERSQGELDIAPVRSITPAAPAPPAPPAPPGGPAPAASRPAADVPGFTRPEFLARLEALPRPVPQPAPGSSGPSIRVAVDRLDALMNLVGELMIARSRLERRLAQLEQVGELLLFSRTRMAHAVRDFESRERFSQRPAAPAREGVEPAATAGELGSLRDVAALFAELEFDRYDDFSILARSVGEMSADVAEVQRQHAVLIRAVREDVAQVQRLTAALRREVTRSRMVPIGRLFTRIAPQVREAARAAGKAVALTVHGESAEVDTSIIEQIADPLLHLIQNAVAHGIESEPERLARGKPAQAMIALRAYQQGSFIMVEVEDDGRGIDAAAVRRQAVEQGLLPAPEAQALSPRDALNLIFVPGFSTAPAVTRASGRGVGLDVVRTNVSRLNGEIEVETELGIRTRFTLKLPLTVAIADAVMVRCGSEVLAFPLSAVSVMRSVSPADIRTVGDRETIRVDDQVIDLIRLDRLLGIGGSPAPVRFPVVVLRGGGKPFGVAVDQLLGREEIVIKGLGALLEGVGPFCGATISGQGRVILLLDPSRLREVGRQQPAATELARGVRPPAMPKAAEEVRRRVMLVDDSISIRKFVGQMLEKAGFRVSTAVDGQDALRQLADLSVDAVVTDLEMPRVNGYALIEDLHRRPGTRSVPIVVLTTRAGEKHSSLARRLGIRHYVTKPVDEASFVRLIESITAGAGVALSGVAAE